MYLLLLKQSSPRAPRHKIEDRMAQCPGGWKKYKNSCYKDLRPQGHNNFQQGEQKCNQQKAHIFLANDRQEYLWVEQVRYILLRIPYRP